MPPPDRNPAPRDSPAPRAGLILMAVILVTLALLSIYSNVQRSRRGVIETVTITRATPTPTASPSVP